MISHFSTRDAVRRTLPWYSVPQRLQPPETDSLAHPLSGRADVPPPPLFLSLWRGAGEAASAFVPTFPVNNACT